MGPAMVWFGVAWQLQGNLKHSYLKSILKCAFGAQFACKYPSCWCGDFVDFFFAAGPFFLYLFMP